MFLLLSGALFAEVWYKSYDDALKAIKKGAWSEAEKELKDALASEPVDNHSKRTSGTIFVDYIPNYWLGVVYFNQGRYQEAHDQLQRVQKGGVITSKSKEYSSMTSYLEQASTKLKPAEVKPPQVADQKPPTIEPKPPIETKPPETPNLKAEADAALQKAQDFLSQRRLDDADQAIRAAEKKDPSNSTIPKLRAQLVEKRDAVGLIAKAETLLKDNQFDAATDALKSAGKKDPSNPAIQKLAFRITEARNKFIADNKNMDAQKKQAEFENLMTQASRSLSAKGFDAARGKARQAQTLGIDQKRVLDFLKQIDSAESSFLINEANQAIASGDFEQAEVLAKRITAIGLNREQLDQLVRKIKIVKAVEDGLAAARQRNWDAARRAEQTLAKLDPQNQQLKKLQALIQEADRAADQPPPEKPPVEQKPVRGTEKEDEALLAYLNGEYKKAAEILKTLTATGKSAEIYFYLGCSNAALALMREPEADRYLKEARENFATVHRLNARFQFDPDLISPRIIKIYNEAQ